MLCTFYDPRPLKLRKVDPRLLIFTSIILYGCRTCLILLTRILLLSRHFDYEGPRFHATSGFFLNRRITMLHIYKFEFTIKCEDVYCMKH